MRDLPDESHADKRHKRRSTGFCQLWIAFAFGCISTYTIFASLGTQPKLPGFKYRMRPTPEHVAIYTEEELQSFSRNRLSGRYWQIADEKTESRVFNGSPSYKSEFKGPPSPQVDATWSQYWKVWSFWATPEEIGKTKEDLAAEFVVEMPKSNDEGTKHMVMNEAVHQLHCLYNLYRATNFDYYEEEARFARLHPQVWHSRVDHCLDILRQKLECDWDPSLIAFKWTNETDPVPDFNVQHECRSRDSLLDLISSREIREYPSKPVEVI
ncbi:hypothetical protein G7Y89_g12175 [Cudoniella acicularis]|uniref:Cyclochlorotine biosynthesis protein O n=1 Tax=Cudoniella acicularis TaxID=354080 RepID=A0A8H4R9L5_9HELO|nr:hypothetical protein G7Y89_g12175 [Cudoniella acicularis]